MTKTDPGTLEELRERLQGAVGGLETLRSEAELESERIRLRGKREGVQLALSFCEETIRFRDFVQQLDEQPDADQ